MSKYRKGQITLQIRVPIQMAISLLGRLYGSGVITKAQYLRKLAQVDTAAAQAEQKKDEKMEKLLKKILAK